MKGIITFLFAIVFCGAASAANYRAALVADMDTGRVLYQENSTVPNYPASLTKIMTLYLTFDALEHGRLHLDDYLIVSGAAANASPVKLGLAAGSKITVEDAIKAVAVVSANDVARVLAENLKGGKEGNFAELMTRVANEIGLANTHFENSSGLPNDDQLSTARDIALLAMAVYKHFPQYWKYFGIKTWVYNGKTYTNGNRLLGSYPGFDGMKTGFTNKSKYSLVATAARDGHHLISVVLGAENKDVRANISTQMLNRGFKIVGVKNSVPVVAPVQTDVVPTLSAAYNAATSQSAPGVTVASGPVVNKPVVNVRGTGVQFGAFGSHGAAQNHVATIKNKLGVDAVVEQTDAGLWRVRAYTSNALAANDLKQRADVLKIDNFIFH